jgi:hypothetical protein
MCFCGKEDKNLVVRFIHELQQDLTMPHTIQPLEDAQMIGHFFG